LAAQRHIPVWAAKTGLVGLRQGRVEDPFGHLWIVSQVI